jgi:SOS-response transcriptional repressor LexA
VKTVGFGDFSLARTFAEILKSLIDRAKVRPGQKDLSQNALAKMCGVSSGPFSQYLNGTKSPSYETLESLARGLGVPVGVFFGAPIDGIKLLGEVGAGAPRYVPADETELVDVSLYFKSTDDVVRAVRVVGDSMVGDLIASGDYVIIRENPAPASGEIVLAWLAGEEGLTLKKYNERGDEKHLIGSGKPSKRIVLDEAAGDRIVGAYLGVIRRG